jgi:hypothetical protein
MIRNADTPMNIGTPANSVYEMPPMIGPLTATSALLADMTRWKTSCCGIEPIMMVIAAPVQNSHSCSPPRGKKLNMSRDWPNSITRPTPPA